MSNNTPWTQEENDIALDYGNTNQQVAELTGHTLKSVRSKRERFRRMARLGCIDFNGPKGPLGTSSEKPLDAATIPSHEADKKKADNAYWQHQYDALNREYQKSIKQNVVIDRLIADIQSVAPLSYSPAPRISSPFRQGNAKQTPESAVLLLSDTHIGKVVRREQTLGFAQYDFPTFLARLKFLETRVLSILEGHTTAPIEELVIPMIGDMLDGSLAHGSEAAHRNTIFNQFYAGGHALAQFLRALAARVPKIRIVTCVGNHTRFGTQKKMPTENRFSNFDSFLYVFVQSLVRDILNIEWVIDEQPFAVFKVQGWTFFASHGDNLKGGDAAFGIPMHSMARQMNATTQLFHKHGAEVPQYYVLGHFHRPIQLPTGLGDFTVNGGFPGLDGYGLTGNFNPVDPAQVFFRVHPKYGKIAEYKLQLKFANMNDSTYVLPAQFPCE